jgi:hypothetical protein
MALLVADRSSGVLVPPAASRRACSWYADGRGRRKAIFARFVAAHVTEMVSA